MSILVALICLLYGVVLGRWLERRSWILRADSDTPNYADGRFWFVVSEERVGSPTALPERCKECDTVLSSRWMSNYCEKCREKIEKECGR
jgi:hypothetical protein